ncbi:MAG: hypothetical protein G01um101419_311 [Parcubacteria group bacterium Gr01-1014_19]|nr:MAG: hypothetical protein G01um101419_311 [Parcubacteria group bacterium Gr01-1014_19]
MKVTEAQFKEFLEKKLGDNYLRALQVFGNYSPNMTYDVVNVLLHAVDKGKVVEVLEILEKHFTNHLSYQHPDARGRVNPGPTAVMFEGICAKTLGLKKNSPT